MVTTDHLAPFHFAVSPPVKLLGKVKPTAQHRLADGQVIPARTFGLPGWGFGLDTIDHLVPFQLSASVVSWLDTPTAWQSLALAQETASSEASVDPDG